MTMFPVTTLDQALQSLRQAFGCDAVVQDASETFYHDVPAVSESGAILPQRRRSGDFRRHQREERRPRPGRSRFALEPSANFAPIPIRPRTSRTGYKRWKPIPPVSNAWKTCEPYFATNSTTIISKWRRFGVWNAPEAGTSPDVRRRPLWWNCV